MTNACDPIDSGAAWARNIYSAHHNPALYFTGLQGGRVDEAIAPAAACRTNDLAMGTTGPDDSSAFDAALQAGAVGDLNLVIPNDCENGHDPCGTGDRIRQFDDFLARRCPGSKPPPPSAPTARSSSRGTRAPIHHRIPATSCSPRSDRLCDRARSTARATTTTGSSGTLAEGLGVRPPRTPPPRPRSARSGDKRRPFPRTSSGRAPRPPRRAARTVALEIRLASS